MKTNIDEQYLSLLRNVKDNGYRKETRNGHTRSIFGAMLRHPMKDGLPLLTTKKVFYKGIISELLWFLKGRSDLRWLLERGNKIWVGDAYKKYTEACSSNDPKWNYWMKDNGDGSLSMYTQEEFIKEIKKILTDNIFSHRWGDLGRIYGKQWRSWDKRIDQIKNLIDTLRTNPDSRRMMVSAWNPSEIEMMTLPPCHYGFQVYTRPLSFDERADLVFSQSSADETESLVSEGYLNDTGVPSREISMVWSQRSVDIPLGLPFNIASYALLLKLLANEVNMVPGDLIGSLGDCHVYENQMEGVKEQLKRDPNRYSYPQITLEKGIRIEDPQGPKFPTMDSFNIKGYESYPKIKFPLSN